MPLYYEKTSYFKEDLEMTRSKFEGRLNEIMLTAIKAARNEDGTTDSRDMKAVGLLREVICYATQMNYEIECLKKEIKVLKNERKENEEKKIGA